jgi:hypothetical protein
MLLGMFGNNHCRQFVRRPKVSCRAHVGGLSKRTARDADGRIARRRHANRASRNWDRSCNCACGRCRWDGTSAGGPVRQGKRLGSDDHSNAERGGGSFAAPAAVANVDLERRCEKFEARLAALAAPRSGDMMHAVGHGCGRAPSVWPCPLGSNSLGNRASRVSTTIDICGPAVAVGLRRAASVRVGDALRFRRGHGQPMRRCASPKCLRP